MSRPQTVLQAKFDNRLGFELLLTEVSARFASVTPELMDHRTPVQLEDCERFVVTHSWQLPDLEHFQWAPLASLNGFAFSDTGQTGSGIGVTASVPVSKHEAVNVSYRDGTYISAWRKLYENVSAASRYSWWISPKSNTV